MFVLELDFYVALKLDRLCYVNGVIAPDCFNHFYNKFKFSHEIRQNN